MPGRPRPGGTSATVKGRRTGTTPSLDMHGGPLGWAESLVPSSGGCSCTGSDGPARGSAADSASPNEAPRAASRQRHGDVTGAPRAAFEVSGCLGEDLLGARLHPSSVTRQGMDHPGAAVADRRVPAGEPAPGCPDAASGQVRRGASGAGRLAVTSRRRLLHLAANLAQRLGELDRPALLFSSTRISPLPFCRCNAAGPGSPSRMPRSRSWNGSWPPPPRTRPRLRPPGSGSAPPGRPDAAAVVHLHHRGPHPHRAGHGLRGLRRLESDNIWITRNDGTDWAPPSSAVPSAPVRAVAVHPRRFDHVYLGTEVGVFASEDGAATWLPRNEGPANCPASDRRFPAEPGGDGV
jgi:hypothetical protein